MMHSLLQDLKYALRQMKHAPGFSISVIAVLALGIGANAAMFTVLEGTIFRPLPYVRPGELIELNATTSRNEPSMPRLADILIWRERTHTLDSIAYYSSKDGVPEGLRSHPSQKRDEWGTRRR